MLSQGSDNDEPRTTYSADLAGAARLMQDRSDAQHDQFLGSVGELLEQIARLDSEGGGVPPVLYNNACAVVFAWLVTREVIR
jgi:hypothetical protein